MGCFLISFCLGNTGLPPRDCFFRHLDFICELLLCHPGFRSFLLNVFSNLLFLHFSRPFLFRIWYRNYSFAFCMFRRKFLYILTHTFLKHICYGNTFISHILCASLNRAFTIFISVLLLLLLSYSYFSKNAPYVT